METDGRKANSTAIVVQLRTENQCANMNSQNLKQALSISGNLLGTCSLRRFIGPVGEFSLCSASRQTEGAHFCEPDKAILHRHNVGHIFCQVTTESVPYACWMVLNRWNRLWGIWWSISDLIETHVEAHPSGTLAHHRSLQQLWIACTASTTRLTLITALQQQSWSVVYLHTCT